MYAATLQTLPLSSLARRPRCRLEDVVGAGAVAFRWGRDAIWWALEVLGIERGENVLLPASCCDVVLEPFLERGVEFTYYRLTEQLRYSVDDIERRIGGKTRAVYVIHYFGFSQDPSALRELCDRRGLWLIEDCAQALFCSQGRRPLGGFGDAAVFSLRKILPVPDGGCLKVRGSHAMPARPRPCASGGALLNALKLVVYDLGLRGLLPVAQMKRLWLGLRLGRGGDVGAGSYSDHHRGMSRVSARILARIEPADIVGRRRGNFRYWLDRLSGSPRVKLLYDTLLEGVTPYSFPILVENADSLLARLRLQGLDLEPTLNAPFYKVRGLLNSSERFADTEAIAARLISLPVHQALSPRALDLIGLRLERALCA